jgi:FMN-dependent NADH-azoreductase
MKLMHVDSSPVGTKSRSRMLAAEFVEKLRTLDPNLTVDYLDLAEHAPPHTTGAFVAASYAKPDQRTPEMNAVLAESDALCQRLLDADALLLSVPMYNWSMPSTTKSFIEATMRAGLTFGFDANGGLIGLVNRQKVLFVTTRGGDTRPGAPFAGMDALTAALQNAFAFIGVTHTQFVDAQPIDFGTPEECAAALDRARAELAVIAEQWAPVAVS